MGKFSSVIFAFGVLIGATASATPGDIGCRGFQGGHEITLLLGIDTFEQQTPSLIEVTQNGTVVFSSSEVSETIENVGTEEDPILNTVWSANDEESNARVRVPEHGSLPTRLFHAFLTVETDSGLFRASDLPILCER